MLEGLDFCERRLRVTEAVSHQSEGAHGTAFSDFCRHCAHVLWIMVFEDVIPIFIALPGVEGPRSKKKGIDEGLQPVVNRIDRRTVEVYFIEDVPVSESHVLFVAVPVSHRAGKVRRCPANRTLV